MDFGLSAHEFMTMWIIDGVLARSTIGHFDYGCFHSRSPCMINTSSAHSTRTIALLYSSLNQALNQARRASRRAIDKPRSPDLACNRIARPDLFKGARSSHNYIIDPINKPGSPGSEEEKK
jgi:hypothetical protein